MANSFHQRDFSSAINNNNEFPSTRVLINFAIHGNGITKDVVYEYDDDQGESREQKCINREDSGDFLKGEFMHFQNYDLCH